jgi:hypothetical protein
MWGRGGLEASKERVGAEEKKRQKKHQQRKAVLMKGKNEKKEHRTENSRE